MISRRNNLDRVGINPRDFLGVNLPLSFYGHTTYFLKRNNPAATVSAPWDTSRQKRKVSFPDAIAAWAGWMYLG